MKFAALAVMILALSSCATAKIEDFEGTGPNNTGFNGIPMQMAYSQCVFLGKQRSSQEVSFGSGNPLLAAVHGRDTLGDCMESKGFRWKKNGM